MFSRLPITTKTKNMTTIAEGIILSNGSYIDAIRECLSLSVIDDVRYTIKMTYHDGSVLISVLGKLQTEEAYRKEINKHINKEI